MQDAANGCCDSDGGLGMDNSPDQTGKEQPRETDATQERRRVIRGMAALPVMMTLMNGSARAADSNLVCIDKNAMTLEEGLDASNPADANNRHCVLATDVTASQPARTGAYDQGPGTPVRFLPTDDVGGINYVTPDQQACVVYVDATGNVTSFDSTSYPANSPVTGSCYASFTPTV